MLSAAGASPSRGHGHHASDPTTPTVPDTAQAVASTMQVQDRGGWDDEATSVADRSDQAGASSSESKDAISASGALNRPRLSSGGTTASTASSFSEGSMRR